MVAELRGRALVTVILLTSGVDFLLFGYDQGLFGGILAGTRFQNMLGNPNSTMSGLVTAIYDVGCAFGAVSAFLFGERIGRKRSIIYANIIVIIGAIIQAASYSYAQMFVARIIAGIGIGLSTVAVPILQSETLPAHNRGSLLVVQSALIVVGISIASWVCLGTLYAESSMQWRFPIACQILFSFVVLVLCLWLPESPRWMAKTGNVEEARNLISRVLDKPLDSEEVESQLSEILKFLALEEEAGEAAWHEIFRNNTKSRNLQRVLLGMGPYLMNQWSGINSLSYYLGYILQTFLGYSQVVSLVLAGVAFTQCAIFSTPPYFFIDKIGRRNTIMLSSGACAVCLFIISGSLQHQRSADAAAAVAFIFLYLDCYVLGFLPVSWSYSAEIQPLRVRNKATAIGVFSHWISNFVVVMVTPIGINNIGGNFFWIWAIICALFVPVAYVFGVETSGRTLEEVDQMFFDEPRIMMGLNPNHRRVIRASPGGEVAQVRAVKAQGDGSDLEATQPEKA
ncbi:MFS domain-containing protein [Fusarium keratoplasticum]|nr:MFS domain-containing protein [Fusarium keratoplasticum]KAI8650899.1 MFS domain-containing protein [Fusarium keratoplasticum]